MNIKKQVQLFFLFILPLFAYGQKSLYLHLDRLHYFTEDSVYYSIYSFDENLQMVSDRMAYIELLNADSKQIVKVRTGLNSGRGFGSFQLPDTLSSGLYQIIGFTRSMKTKNEKNFFRQMVYIINRHDRVLDFRLASEAITDNGAVGKSIHLNDSVFYTRQKVNLSFDSLLLGSNVSISISHQLPLSLKLKTIAEIAFQQDSLFDAFAEDQGQLLVGKVIDATSEKPVPDKVVLLSTVDSIPNIQYAVSDKNGIFRMLLNEYYQGKELFLTIQNPPLDESYYLEYIDPYRLNTEYSLNLKNKKLGLVDVVERFRKLSYVKRVFQEMPKDIKWLPGDNSIQKFHYEKTIVVRPSEFEHLDYFDEIVVELLPKLRIVNSNGKRTFQVLNPILNKYDDNPPAVFLDGVFLDDIEKLTLLGSDYIDRIEMIAYERVFGDLVFGGMVAIYTKNLWAKKAPLAGHSLKLKNDRELNAPHAISVNKEQLKSESAPLVDRLLYWNPKVEIFNFATNKIEFYTPDYSGRFLIRIEGVDAKGNPISDRIEFVVQDADSVTN